MTLVEYTVKDRVAFITLNRPEKRNALNHELVVELRIPSAASKVFV
jgi:methylglutaconyl-CoA hydratase